MGFTDYREALSVVADFNVGGGRFELGLWRRAPPECEAPKVRGSGASISACIP